MSFTIPEEEEQQLAALEQQWKGWWNGSIRTSSPEERETFYITTAINYTNGFPHMGHAYEAVTADMFARYHRLAGRDTFFLTGSDEHGQKIAERAEKEGAEPITICDRFSSAFQVLNRRALVSNDRYVRTTHPDHYKTAQAVLQRSIDAGDVYLDMYSGWYNVKEEAFVSETDAQLYDYKDPSTGTPLVKMEEKSYFFKMSRFTEALLQHNEENPTFIQPDSQRDFIIKRLRDDPLHDLSISRTTFKWGIPFPTDPEHVLYVWFDALTNYLTGVNWPEGEGASYWPANLQVIGKDIVWFHTVIWPAMLLSAGIPLPKQVFAHGFVNDEEGRKMSKTKENVVDPHPILSAYPADTFRLFLVHNITYGNDLPFSEANLVMVHNADLADSLGNLVNRVANITSRYFKGVTPEATYEQIFDVAALRTGTEEHFQKKDIGGAYMLAIQAVKDVNNYLTTKEPWKIKEDPGDVKKAQIIRSVLEAIYVVAHFLAPFVPATSAQMFDLLGAAPRALPSLSADQMHLTAGSKIGGKFPFQKFPLPGQEALEEEKKKEAAAALAKANKLKKQKQKSKNSAPAANQPLFTKLDLRVGHITKVWKHPASDKLWCEEIDVGGDAPIQVCSGLQRVYTLEEMEGQRCVVVNNLKASKLGGVLSQGMVLCAKSEDGSQVEFLSPPEAAKPGERLTIPGAEGEPVSSAQVKKQKVWEEVSKALRTNDDLQGIYDGTVMQTSAGPCTVKSLKNVFVS